MEPVWDEHCFLLIGSEEINAEECLRLQLWDSDRFSADDDLGRVELDLKDLMNNEKSKGCMWEREDELTPMDGKGKMPGKVFWEVGYYDKVRITKDQLEKQDAQPDVKTLQQLKDKVDKSAGRKLREADHDVGSEIEQQKAQDYQNQENELIASSPPPDGYPSGILSIEIHNAFGLEVANLRKTSQESQEDTDERENDDLPSPYCSVMLNETKVYVTRTKPKVWVPLRV